MMRTSARKQAYAGMADDSIGSGITKGTGAGADQGLAATRLMILRNVQKVALNAGRTWPFFWPLVCGRGGGTVYGASAASGCR